MEHLFEVCTLLSQINFFLSEFRMYKMIKDCVHSLVFICLYTFHVLVRPDFSILKVFFMNLCGPYFLICLSYLYFILVLNPHKEIHNKKLWIVSCHSVKPVDISSSNLVLFYKILHGLWYTYWQKGRSSKSCIRGETNTIQGVEMWNFKVRWKENQKVCYFIET